MYKNIKKNIFLFQKMYFFLIKKTIPQFYNIKANSVIMFINLKQVMVSSWRLLVIANSVLVCSFTFS